MRLRDCVEALRTLKCWVATRKAIRRHPRIFHTCYAASHLTYLVTVWHEGHTWYALAAGPAAIAYVAVLVFDGTSGE